MRRSVLWAVLLSAVATFAAPDFTVAAEAGDGVKARKHVRVQRGTRVKGFVSRGGVGGYSFIWADSINTYGDARGRYGSATVFRDPNLGRQTPGGPFDHGFFFDSGLFSPHGGSSPYMH